MTLRRSLVLATVLGVSLSSTVASFAAPTATAADRTVDPSTLTPPPPDFFNAACSETGSGIVCDLAFVDPGAPVEEPTGITCGVGAGQFEVLDTWTRFVQGKRLYSTDGLLLRRHFSDRWDGTFTNSVTGATVGYSQRGTYLHDLAVPGDNSSGVERDTVRLRVFAASGTVLIAAGRTVAARSDGTILFQAGQHPFDAYFEQGNVDALAPLCDALS